MSKLGGSDFPRVEMILSYWQKTENITKNFETNERINMQIK